MIKVLTIVFVLFAVSSFAQNDKLANALIKYFKQAKTFQEVQKAINIIEKADDKYKQFYVFIPSNSPLNPTKTKRVSSKFGNRFHPIDGKVKKHLGLDVSAKTGTPVHATAKGTIQKVKHSNSGYGNVITIEHLFGFETKYAHLDKTIVKQGQAVKKGDIIGFVGNTGKSTGSHLHYEVIKNKRHIDPYPFCTLLLENIQL